MDNKVNIIQIKFDTTRLLYEDWQHPLRGLANSIDYEKTKSVFSVLLQDASEKINNFNWRIYCKFYVIDASPNKKQLEFVLSLYLNEEDDTPMSMRRIIFKGKDTENYVIDYNLPEGKSLEPIWDDFLNFVQERDCYVLGFSSKRSKIESSSQKLNDSQSIFFSKIDFLDKEFNYKYTNAFYAYTCLYWIGKEVYFNTDLIDWNLPENCPSARSILKDVIQRQLIYIDIPQEQINEILKIKDVNEMIGNIRMLLY